MKILLANPAFRRHIGGDMERYMLGSGMRFPWSLLKRKNERPRYAMFPFFMSFSAALLEKSNFDVCVIDGVPLNLTESEFEAHVREVNPSIIVFEPNTAVIDDVLAMADRLYNAIQATIVLTGSHVSSFTEILMRSHKNISYIVIGEYEVALRNLMLALRNSSSLSDVRGLAFRSSDGNIVINERAEPLDLAELPPPARHMFPAYFDNDMSLYHDGFCQNSPSFHMHSSRGCPFSCNFCVWVQVLYQNGQQRFFTPARIVDEMQLLKEKYNAKEIYFDDDNFTANRKHVSDLCAEIQKRSLDMSWSAMADAIALNERLLEEMAAAGCIGIKFGLDSADVRILDNIQKPLKIARLESIVEKAKKLGIKTHMSVVFGLTGETRATLDKTFNFSCDLDIDSVQFSIATPCPGTSMYDDLVSEGRIKFKQWDEYDGANTSVVEYDDFSREYLEAFMAKAHSGWLRNKFLKPIWVARQMRFLARTAKTQGFMGVVGRIKRAARLIIGDSAIVQIGNTAKSMRW